MSHFSDDPRSVRVDFFRESGKWYTTEAVLWTGPYAGELIHNAFAKSLRDHFKEQPRRLADMVAVCLEPYHEHGHPIMFTPGRWLDPKFDEPSAAPETCPISNEHGRVFDNCAMCSWTRKSPATSETEPSP